MSLTDQMIREGINTGINLAAPRECRVGIPACGLREFIDKETIIQFRKKLEDMEDGDAG